MPNRIVRQLKDSVLAAEARQEDAEGIVEDWKRIVAERKALLKKVRKEQRILVKKVKYINEEGTVTRTIVHARG